MTSVEAKRLRAEKIKEGRAIAKKAGDEKRSFTPEESQQLAAITAAAEEFNKQVQMLVMLESDETVDGDADVTDDGQGEPGMSRQLQRTRALNGQPDLPDLCGKHPYRYTRALLGLMDGKLDGIEGEVHQEFRNQGQVQKGTTGPSLFLPWRATSTKAVEKQMRKAKKSDVEFRTTGLVDTTAGTGSIANILGTDLIDLLRNKMALKDLGARVMTGMTGGTFSLPKRTQASTAYWVAESAAPTTSNTVIGQVTWTPKTVGSFTDLSRKFLLQTSLDAEAVVRDDLGIVMAIEMDRVGANGSGSGAQPTGIMNNGSVTIVPLGTNGADPTWANVVALETTVANANSDLGKLGYLTSPSGRGIMKTSLKSANTAAKYIWDADNPDTPINGYRALATNQIPKNLTKGTSSGVCTAMIFGNFDSAVYALWGGLEVIIDPYSLSTVGAKRFVMLQDCDFELRQNGAFAQVLDMLEV
jgi:HK97 family phage major capsid protein